ncbi:MAG: NAD(P)H-dependent oxidoreductase [Brooklawnia sp.]|uniref:NADPH-dependent FMN reductase n=1 Tax=Brooklawnia sp. TaxID=2699740 RepID=UPI003C7743A0
MTRIAIVTGSVRPGRHSLTVADWVKSIADKRSDAQVEVVDIADFQLPVWKEAVPPSGASGGSTEQSKAWSQRMGEFDGFTVLMSLFHDFEGFTKFAPSKPATAAVGPMLDNLVLWTKAMEAVRAGEFEVDRKAA